MFAASAFRDFQAFDIIHMPNTLHFGLRPISFEFFFARLSDHTANTNRRPQQMFAGSSICSLHIDMPDAQELLQKSLTRHSYVRTKPCGRHSTPRKQSVYSDWEACSTHRSPYSHKSHTTCPWRVVEASKNKVPTTGPGWDPIAVFVCGLEFLSHLSLKIIKTDPVVVYWSR